MGFRFDLGSMINAFRCRCAYAGNSDRPMRAERRSDLSPKADPVQKLRRLRRRESKWTTAPFPDSILEPPYFLAWAWRLGLLVARFASRISRWGHAQKVWRERSISIKRFAVSWPSSPRNSVHTELSTEPTIATQPFCCLSSSRF